MKKKLKLLFDECIGKPVMDELANIQQFSGQQFELEHILDKRKQGEWDEVWIPQLDPEEWVVVTGDRGKGGKKKGEKLPRVCEENGITCIVLGPSIHQLTSDKKIVAIAAAWDEIAKIADAPAGSAYLLSMAGSRAKLTLKIKKPKKAKKKPKR